VRRRDQSNVQLVKDEKGGVWRWVKEVWGVGSEDLFRIIGSEVNEWGYCEV